jgi:hypothetical protein
MRVQNLFIALTTSVFAVSTCPSWSVAARSTQSIQNVTRQIPSTLTAQLTYGTTRTNRTCPSRVNPKNGTLSLEQAKTYFVCDFEALNGNRGENYSAYVFVDNLQLDIAPKSRPTNDTDLKLGYREDIDLQQFVYPIRVSYTKYICNTYTPGSSSEGKNCITADDQGVGICFRNTFGDWHCKANYRESNNRRGAPPS